MTAAADLIVDFVNTLDADPYEESLDSPAALAAWLEGRGLLEHAAPVDDGDLRRALEAREALRTLLAAHNDCEVDEAAAADVLDQAAARAGLALRFGPDRAYLEPAARGVDGAVGRVLAAVAETMADDTWPRLKACRDEGCRWAFLDTAKNRSRAWCSMRSCGNRAKVRAYRDRRATG